MSESSDEDYVPGENVENSESSGSDECDDELEPTSAGNRKRLRKSVKSGTRQKCIKVDKNEEEHAHQHEPSEEEKKKNVDDLWADFMKDTGFQSRKASSVTCNNKITEKVSSKREATSNSNKVVSDKIKITEEFDFAGEKISVVKEVLKDTLTGTNPSKRIIPNSSKQPHKEVSGGVNRILNQLGKKPKLSTLDKSKLDWDQFKREENLEEELQFHNKGKDGYLERQDFLERADLRRFEIEKKIRSNERGKRGNNSL